MAMAGQNWEFRTFNDLKNLLREKVGLDLEISKGADGKVGEKVSLELKNNSYNNFTLSLEGVFLKS